MSSACRQSRRLIGLLGAAAAAMTLHAVRSEAEQPVVPFDCDQQVCGFNVIAKNLRVAPCTDRAVLVAYSSGDGASLIQCSTFGDLQANLTYAFDRIDRADPGVELTATRFLKPSSLAEIIDEGVPDQFARVPLCAPPRSTVVVPGRLLLVMKVPRSNNSPCYQLLQIEHGLRGLVVRAEEGTARSARTAATSKWNSMMVAMLPLIGAPVPEHAAKDEPRLRRVTAARAPLFDEPDAKLPTHMYLIKGDAVEVLEGQGADGNWIRARSVTKSGKPIERWILASDLEMTTL